MDLSKFDFIDFGASRGGAIEFAKKKLGGHNGIGVDLNPKKVAAMQALGYDCLQGDITQLDLPDKSFRFVVMSHVLEHLKNKDDCRLALKEAARVATDFLYIQGPFFEEDDWLASKGFRLSWSHWRCHSLHLNAKILQELAQDLGFGSIQVYAWGPIPSSSHPSIHPLSSPINQYDYDPKVHPKKRFQVFNKPIYREIICLIPLRPAHEIKALPDVLGIRTGMVLVNENGRVAKKTILKENAKHYLKALGLR